MISSSPPTADARLQIRDGCEGASECRSDVRVGQVPPGSGWSISSRSRTRIAGSGRPPTIWRIDLPLVRAYSAWITHHAACSDLGFRAVNIGAAERAEARASYLGRSSSRFFERLALDDEGFAARMTSNNSRRFAG